MNALKFYTKELAPDLWKDFESYFDFEGKSSGCWCMNHRLPIGLNFEGEAAKLAMRQLVESGRVFGVLAYAKNESVPIGWCSLDRRKTLTGHDCIGEDIACDKDTWAIHCITSRVDFKKMGVEELLSEAALTLASKLNAKLVEAYPEPGSTPQQEFKTWNVFNPTLRSKFGCLAIKPNEILNDSLKIFFGKSQNIAIWIFKLFVNLRVVFSHAGLQYRVT